MNSNSINMRKNATSRSTSARCYALATALLMASLCVGVIPTVAQAQSGQRVVEGSQQWGRDGWLYVVRGGRWVRTNSFRGQAEVEAQLRYLVDELNQQTAAARAAAPAAARATTAAPARTQTLKPGESAPGVAMQIPMYGPLTAAQRRVVEASNAQALGHLGRIAQSSACEQARAASPYYSYGTPGNTTTGWTNTMTGPRQNAC
jgi:hypothetical protein